MPITFNFNDNPILLTGYALFAAAGIATLTSVAILVGAFLHNPDINISNDRELIVKAVDSAEISKRNFFGFADAEPEIAIDDLPETQLNLTLRGAFAGKDEKQAGAIIENNDDSKSEHYTIGEEVPGEATVKGIYADRVVLARNGLLETLYFPDLGDSSGIGSRKNVNSSAVTRQKVETADEAAARGRREAIRARIKQLRGR